MYSTIRKTLYCDGDREASLPKLKAAIHGIKDYLVANHAGVTLDNDEVEEDDIETGNETGDLKDG